MEWDLVFFTNSLLLGVGLAMDAFSVSMANGLRQPEMSRRRMAGIAGDLCRVSGRYAAGGVGLRPHRAGGVPGV